jgi:hypothetical protein
VAVVVLDFHAEGESTEGDLLFRISSSVQSFSVFEE